MDHDVIICLDIGGTNCRMGIVDAHGALLECQIIPTAELAKEDFLQALTHLLQAYRRSCDQTHRVVAVSMGFPATIDKARRCVLQAPNIPGFGESMPVCDVLEQALDLPVFLERDVNLLLAHDLQALHLQDADTVIGIYFGTGIGNSIYIGGRFHGGHNGVAGELGHIPQLQADCPCGCGNVGCLEPLGGGRRLSQLCEEVFTDTDIKEIYLRHSDDARVRQQVEAMAVAVATEVNILDPDYVVLGGGLLQMWGFPLANFEARIRAHTRRPYPLQNLRLVYALPNQENGLLGAGIYGWNCLHAKKSI